MDSLGTKVDEVHVAEFATRFDQVHAAECSWSQRLTQKTVCDSLYSVQMAV